MEYLVRAYDESDRLYQSLVDLKNAAWPDLPWAAGTAKRLGRSLNVLNVRTIRIKLETQPAR